mgnify:CR=1 FL=1
MTEQHRIYIPRRRVLRGILATAAFAATTKLAGCASGEASNDGGSGAKPLVLGFVYVGAKDDFGWNQAQAEGAKGIKDLPGVKLVEQASVPETKEVQEVMRSMIEQDGAAAIFATSFGYFKPHVLEMAKQFPEVQFFHCSTLWEEGMPTNIGNYYADIDDAQYVCGKVAAETAKTGKLGYVAAKPVNPVLRSINSFMLGAQSVKPDAKMQVIFTGDWNVPVKEAEATNTLADQGIEVVGMHIDSPKVVVETAEKRGMYASGFHTDQSTLAPKGYLTGTAYDWSNVFKKYVELLQADKKVMDGGIPRIVQGSFAEGYVKVSPFGAAVSEATKKDAETAIAKIKDGSLVVYSGPIEDNKGAVKIPAGKSFKLDAPELDQINWLTNGVLGSVG